MKIATILLKYDYGIKERGDSLEKIAFLPAIKKYTSDVYEFWLEENGYPEDKEGLQRKIIEFCDKSKPDYVFFILMKDEVKISTLEELKKRYKTINFFCDDQWRFENFSKYVAPTLSYALTVDKFSMDKYRKIGCNSVHTQWGTFNYKQADTEKKYEFDISFVGGKNSVREWYIDQLKQCGIHVECFGSGWANGRVSEERMCEIFKNSRINLNLSNSIPRDYLYHDLIKQKLILKSFKSVFKINRPKKYMKAVLGPLLEIQKLKSGEKSVEQLKARNYEIAGCGGFQLSQYALELEDYFDIGKEIAIFTNISELEKQVRYYLEEENKREEISYRGYLRAQEYSYDKIIFRAFEEIKQCEKPV